MLGALTHSLERRKDRICLMQIWKFHFTLNWTPVGKKLPTDVFVDSRTFIALVSYEERAKFRQRVISLRLGPIQARGVSSATLRFFSLDEQCHTQKFYLRCFKLDFDVVKIKFGLLIE